jgi:hypothetical protein
VIILVFRQKDINDRGFDISLQWTSSGPETSKSLGPMQFASNAKHTDTITGIRRIGSRTGIPSMTDIELQTSGRAGITTEETRMEELEDLNGKDSRQMGEALNLSLLSINNT